MKISILSTFYNSKESLKRVMDSVLMQTCHDIEHVIVDAASKDGSVELLRSYEEKYIQSGIEIKWISEPDKGIYYGINKAFSLSTGDYVMLALDPYVDGKVLADVEKAILQENPDYLYGGVYYQRDGRIIRNWSGRPGNWKLGWMAATPTLCMRRYVMEKCGPFDVDNLAADYKFQIKMFQDKTLKSYHLNRMMVVFYAGGTSNGGLKANIVSIKEGQRALKDCGVQHAWFITLCKILRAVCGYTFVLHKKIDLTDSSMIDKTIS